MSKISGPGARHQDRQRSVCGLSPFDRIPRVADDRHPVDVAVETRLEDRVRRKWIVKIQNRIVGLLGQQHSGLYLKLEAMVNEQQRDRERCFFNVGYEHGVAEASVVVGQRPRKPMSRAESLVKELLQRMFQEDLHVGEVTTALLRCALSITETSRPR